MDFFRWAQGFPGLLWVVERKRSRIKILNSWQFPALGENSERLLKDIQFRRRMVVKSDLPLLAEFWEMMMRRQPAAVSFRLNDDLYISYRLQGWPHPDDPELYLGFFVESMQPATFVANGEAGTCQLALGVAQYPVLVVSMSQRNIIVCNEAANELFGEDFLLSDIAPGELGDLLIRAAKQALKEGAWAGTLMLRMGSGCLLGSKVRISPCFIKGDIVRIALLNIPDTPASCDFHPRQNEIPPDFSLKKELEKLLELCPAGASLMFSDIQPSPGLIQVYGVGKLFSSLEWGASYAYEGTIAQDLERFGLDSLTLEDTLDSIKSIDWALFNPCGVRSYFAKPFYSAAGLNTVFILAFDEPGTACALVEEELRPIYEKFIHIVALWRTQKGWK